MQTVLMDQADTLGCAVGFVKRQRKLSGSTFVQAGVFGVQAKPDASYTDLSQSAASVGAVVSPQGLEQRFTEEAACLLQGVLGCAVEQAIPSQPAAIPILQRFEGVYLRDRSVINVPTALAQIGPGAGNRCGPTAALKLQVELTFSMSQLKGPVVQSGRPQDQLSPFQQEELPAGALHLADLGDFNLER